MPEQIQYIQTRTHSMRKVMFVLFACEATCSMVTKTSQIPRQNNRKRGTKSGHQQNTHKVICVPLTTASRFTCNGETFNCAKTRRIGENTRKKSDFPLYVSHFICTFLQHIFQHRMVAFAFADSLWCVRKTNLSKNDGSKLTD